MNTKPIKCLLAGMFLNQQPYQEKQEQYGNKNQIELGTSFNEGVCETSASSTYTQTLIKCSADSVICSASH